MEQSFYKPLEYNKIIYMLQQKAVSIMGKEEIKTLVPLTNITEIQDLQNLTTQATEMILKKGSLPLGGAKDITASLTRASLGGMLNITELLHIGDFTHVCKKLKNYEKSENKDDIFPLLQPLFEEIVIPQTLDRKINITIQNETELKDDASPTLRDIRNQIKQCNSKIKDQLNNIIQSQQYKNMLQDTVITLRSGRYCVPIKQEYKTSFNGIVHDQSSTGATVFIEPMLVVSLNNQIRDLASKEKKEIEEILTNLSQLVAEEEVALKNNLQNIIQLDVIFARAELSLEMNAIQPKLNTNGYVNIVNGRHPLINKTSVVPLNIYLGKDFTTLLITGPNTGGKTVSLKTLGLFTIMGQSGLHIPAQICELCVFDNVFADIGDEQSIEQSLSTFSAHMSNIVKILQKATPKSLILLDELGAGTDPTEGAALAISILEYLHKNNICVAVTTHYSQLKIYALSTKGVENASCEFDINTLAPTYRLLIGIPGKSNAFAIASKLGLSNNIIDMAKSFINNQEEKLEDVIVELETNKKTTLMEQDKAKQIREEAEKLKERLVAKEQKLNDQKDKILKKAREDAKLIFRTAEEQANAIIKQMVASSKKTNLHEMDKIRKEITKELTKAEPTNKIHKPLKKVNIGDKVFINSLNYNGIVNTLPDEKGDVLVRSGIMKVKVPLVDLSLDTTEENTKTNSFLKSTIKAQKSQTINTTIDIRGHMVEDGLSILSKYLDDAYLSGLKQITVIHGKGSGVLRSAVQKFLTKSPHVKKHRIGEFGEGDSGVTVVEMV